MLPVIMLNKVWCTLNIFVFYFKIFAFINNFKINMSLKLLLHRFINIQFIFFQKICIWIRI